MSGNRRTGETEDDYGGRADVCAAMFRGSEMPEAQSGNGGGSERFQVAQNFYRIDLPLLADVGGQDHATALLGAVWIVGLDGDDRECATIGGTFRCRIGGSVFVIVDCCISRRHVGLGELERDSYSCLDFPAF